MKSYLEYFFGRSGSADTKNHLLLVKQLAYYLREKIVTSIHDFLKL
jgi:hypothetical protein